MIHWLIEDRPRDKGEEIDNEEALKNMQREQLLKRVFSSLEIQNKIKRSVLKKKTML